MTRGFWGIFRRMIFSFVLLFSSVAFADPVAVAKIGETEYVSLADAVKDVPETGEMTVLQILKDIDLGTSIITVPAGKNISLDLNGKTITSANTSSGALKVSGELLVFGAGTIESTKKYAVQLSAASAKVTLESGTLMSSASGTNGAVYGSDGRFEMTGGEVVSAGAGVDVKTVSIEGGSITATGIAVSGSGEISGGTITSKEKFAAYAKKSVSTLTISGGTLSSLAGQPAVRVYTGNVAVTDGAKLFPAKVDFASNATGIVLAGTDPAYVADSSDLAIYDGETLVGYFTSATTSTSCPAMDGKTVKLTKDISTSAKTGLQIIGYDVTLDLNNHNITSTGTAAITCPAGSIAKPRVVTITGDGKVSCDNGAGCVAVYADKFTRTTIEGGTYSVGGEVDNACIYIGNSYSTVPTTVAITGGSFETGDGHYVLNIKDEYRETASFAVTGGTFKGFDPANNSTEGEGTNFLAEGVISAENSDGSFEVRDYAYITIPVVEHATATVKVNGEVVDIVDGKIQAPIGAKVSVSYAADAEWANTKSVTISKVTADQKVDVGTYKPVKANVKVTAADGTVSYKAFSTTMLSSPIDGATYELLDDVTTTRFTLGSVLAKNKTVTLDLGGHTLTCTDTGTADLLFHSSSTGNTLTVRNGTFNAAGDAFSVSKTNTLVLDESLTVKAAKTCVAVTEGATLETAANLTTTGDTFAIAGNGSAGKGGTTIKVTGGSVTTEGKAPAIYHPQAGTLEISGGTITGATAVYVKSGEVEITGGEFVASGAAYDYAYNGSGAVVTGDALVIDNCGYPGGAPNVSVTGGRFESANGNPIASYAGAKDGATPPESITGFVSGGEDAKTYPTFNKDLPAEYCAPGFMPDDDGNGHYTINTLPEICQVDGERFWSLQMAVEAAAKKGRPVELLDNVQLEEQVLIDGNVTINLAGFTISYTGENTLSSGVLAVKRGGALTIEDSVGDGAIDAGENAYAAIAMTVKGESADGEIAALTVNGGTIKGSYYGIVGNGTRHGTEITINGGTVMGTCPGDNLGIYHPQDGTLTITGGTVQGYSAGVEMRAGSFVMTGGELIATADHVATTPNGNGSTSTGAALAIAQHTTKKPINVSISGGTLSGFAAVYESNPNKTDATDKISISITGGSFTTTGGGTVPVYSADCNGFISGGSFSNRVPDELCNEGFDATDRREDGTYGVTPKKTVAKIGSREFWSIDRAIEAAEPGETVELVADYEGPGFTVGDLKDVVFSTAGFTYTATSPITVCGHLVINDESTIDFKPANQEDDKLFAMVGFAEKVDISAGSFNVPIESAWCDEAFEPTERLENGRYGVKEKVAVCEINGKGYWSVEAALKAADPEDTIKLITDISGDAPAVTLDRGHVTLDLNGHALSSVLVSGAVVNVVDSSKEKTGLIGGADVEKAIVVEAGKLFFDSGRVIAKDKAIAIEQDAKGQLIEVEVTGGTFKAPYVIYQENVNKNESSMIENIMLNIKDGMFTGNVYAEDKRAFIEGGSFDPAPEKKYSKDKIKAEIPSVTVTTELDVVNPYDFKISLREAFLYAQNDGHNALSEEGGYKITFNWAAIQEEARSRGTVAKGVFDMSAAPFEATSELYDNTMGRCKFLLLDGTLDAGEDGTMGEGDRMAVVYGLDFHTMDTTAPVRAVVIKKDPSQIIDRVPEIEDPIVARLTAEAPSAAGSPMPFAEGEEDDEEETGEAVCEVNGNLYTSLRQALATVPDDGTPTTVSLVMDVRGKGLTIPAGKNVTLDLAGYTYETTDKAVTVAQGAALTLANGTLTSSVATALVESAGDLTLSNMKLDATETPKVNALCVAYCGTTTVTGNTRLTAAEGGVALSTVYGLDEAFDAGLSVTFDEGFTGTVTGPIAYGAADRVEGTSWTGSAKVEIRGSGHFDTTFNAALDSNIRIYSGSFANAETVPLKFQAVPLDGLYWQIVTTDDEGHEVVTKYATLPEAYQTIPGDGVNVRITQLFDQTGRGLLIDGNKNVTVDFNGKTYTVEGYPFNINGKHEVVEFTGGTLRTTVAGNLISNMGKLTLRNMNIDLRGGELDPDFRNIISTKYGLVTVTGDTVLGAPQEDAVLAVTAQRNDDWNYEEVKVVFDEDFTGKVVGQIRYGENVGTTSDNSWIDAAVIEVYNGRFDINLTDTSHVMNTSVENLRLHGGTFTERSQVGTRPIGDFAYTEVDIDWEVRARYVHFDCCSFNLVGRDIKMLVDRCWFEGNSARRPDWILESDSTGKTYLQFLNSVIHTAKGAIFVNEVSRGETEHGGYVLLGDSTIGETTGDAVVLVNDPNVETYLANVTFYKNAGKTVDTVGQTRAVNVLSQKNGENLPKAKLEVMTSIYQEEYADEEIFRMDKLEDGSSSVHFGPRWLRGGYPVDEAEQDGGWSLTPAYHLNDESVAGGNCRYIKLALDNDGYIDAIVTALKQNGNYSVFAGEVDEKSALHTLHYDQQLTNLDRGQPSKGAFWIPVDEPSLVVTTIRDTVNPTDLEISLREAINYAKYLATEDQTTISTITFDWEALDEEYEALTKNKRIGNEPGQIADYTMYLGKSIDWQRRSDQGDCHLITGRSAATPISITADELPQGLVINANRSGSVRPYFTVNGSLWNGDANVVFDLGDNTKLKTDHFQVTQVNGTAYQLGKNANLYLTNSSAADNCVNGIVGDTGSTVVLERTSVACNKVVGVKASNVSAQNVAIGGSTAVLANVAQLFNTTVVGTIDADEVKGVNDIVSGVIKADADWFRYSAFDSYDVGDEATTNITHNIAADSLQLYPQESSRLWHYRFPSALDWGRYGTAVATAQSYQWNVNGAAMPVYIWGQRTSKGAALEVETVRDRVAQALPDTWAAYSVGSDTPDSNEMKGAILNDIITNSRNPHEGQLSMGAWQAQTIVAWKTLATSDLTTTDHATDFSRIDLNTYYETLQDAVDALAQNAKNENEKNVQFEGKDAVFLVSATLTDRALGDNGQTVISKGDVAIVGNSYYWSGIKATERNEALIVSNNCSVAIANVGFVESAHDAIKVYDKGDVTLYRSAINGNGGDGVNFTEGASGHLLMFNTTVANNKGTGVRMQDGTAQIYDSTVVGNNQGLAGHGEFYLANSVILRNTVANEEKVTVKGGAYNVMTATDLTDDQIAQVFYNNSLTPWYRMVRINYTGAAGWMGTKVGRDADNWYYLDRGDPTVDAGDESAWVWRSVKNNKPASAPREIITTDQHGESRLLAENAGFHEYAVGAYVPEMELEVEVMDQIYEYNGKAQNPDPHKAIYRIMTGIGKLNQGRQLYFNAADGLFYSDFAYVTNRTTDAVGVAPAAWGTPTVSNPRDDLNNAPEGSKFTFAADVLPLQTGDKINVVHMDVPDAKTHNGYAIDEQGYYYLDGYPFVVDDVVLKKGTTDLTESYKVRFPQTESREYAKMILTPRSVSLSRAFEKTKEYDGTKYVIITAESLEHAGVLFGEVAINPGSKFEYGDAEVLPGFDQYIETLPDGTIVITNDKNTQLNAEDLGFIGSASSMGNYYITTESQNYTSIIVPKQIKVTLDEIAKKVYDGEETTLTFDFTDPRLIYTATNTNKVETYTLAEALVVPTRSVTGTLTVCQESALPEVATDRSQIFRKDVGEYPFYIVCDEIHVWDEVERTDAEGKPKDFAHNYNFNFEDCQAVFTVVPKPITIPIVANDRFYDGTDVVHPEDAVSHASVSTGVKEEAFVVNTVGADNAMYASAHVNGDGEPQAITIANTAKIELTGENGACESNYAITFTASGAILKRPLWIASISGVETKFYDGTTGVKVDTEDLSSYSYDAPTETTGLVGDETIKLTGTGHVATIDVGEHKQEVVWDLLTAVNGSGLASDYALQPFSQAQEDADVVIERRPILLAYSSTKVYDGTFDVLNLNLTAVTTNRAGKVTNLTVEPMGKGADGWLYRIKTGVVNETTKLEEILTVTIANAAFTYREVNRFGDSPKDVLVVAPEDVTYSADETTGAKLTNYAFTLPEVGKGTIELRTITFKCADQTMMYGGQKPDLITKEGAVYLVNPSDLAVGDTITKLTCRFGSIKTSSSKVFQKGFYPDGIVRGSVEIVHEGVSMLRNYSVRFQNGSLQVGPGTLTMVLDPTPFVKDYDGTTDAEPNYAAITLKGLIRDNETDEIDEVTVTGTFTYDTKDVVKGEDGSYTNKTITFHRMAVGGKDAANYNWATDKDENVIVEVSAFGATINPRPATVNVQVADKDYDSKGDATPASFTFANLVTNEEFSLAMGGVTASFADKHAGAGKPVTVSLNAELETLINPVNDASLKSNYAFTFDPATTAAIHGIPLTVKANPREMTYGDDNPELTGEWTITWPGNIGDPVAPVAGEDGVRARTQVGDMITVNLAYADDLVKSTSGNFTAKTHENAMTASAIVVIDDGAQDVTDSYEITFVSAPLTVEPRTLTVSVEGDGVTKIYDGTTAIAPGQENHTIDNNITAELVKNGAADEVDVTGTFAYDTKDVVFANDTYANKTILFSNLELTGSDAGNYTLGTVTEVSDTGATITPFETTVTITANNKTYDGKCLATGSVATFSPRVGNEQFTLDVSKITGTFADRHAATNKAVRWNDYTDALITAVAGTGAIKSNYKFAHNLGATATINPKPATITFAAKNKMYDATTAAERTDDPFVFEDLVAANEDAFAEAFTLDDQSMSYAFSDKNVGEGKTVTASGYNVTFIASSSEGGESVPSDYVFTFTTTAKANITQKPMTISYTTKDKVYDATPKATRDVFTYTGLCDGDKVVLDDSKMSYFFADVDGVENTGKDVGEHKVVQTPADDFTTNGKMTGADAGNYSYTFMPESTATITRRPVTIAFALVEKTYDGMVEYLDGEEPKRLVPVVTNMAVGESLDVNATGAFVDSIHNEIVTDYFQVYTFAITGDCDLGNYTVTWAKDRVLALDAGTTAFAMKDEGAFFTDGRINRRPITITANDQTMTYGEENPDLNTEVSGGENCDWAITAGEKVAWETVTVNLKYGTIKTSTSGCYTATEEGAPHANAIVMASVVVENVVAEGESPNVTDSYAITFVNGKLSVAKRAIELTVDGTQFEKVYDGNRTTEAADRNYTFCAYEKGEGCGPVTGDLLDATGTYTYNSKDVKEANTVTFSDITLTKADAANYTLKATEVVSSEGAKITARETVITVTPTSREYDGTTATTAKVEKFSDLVTNENGTKESFVLEKATLSATFAQSDVGTGIAVTYGNYKDDLVTAGPDTSKDNYTFRFTESAVGDITKRPSTITWEANDKQYDAKVAATVKAGSFKFGNLVDGEAFSMNEAGFTYTFADKNVGTAKPVTAVPNGTLEARIAPVADPAKVANYAFTLTKTAPADITPAPLTITFTTKDKTYDATAKATRDEFTYEPLLVDDYGKTDDVTLDDSQMEYEFVDVGGVENTGKNADAGKTVKTVEGKGYDKSYLRGVDKDNYDVTFTDASTATINKMELRLLLPKADKVYDATTALREGTLVTTLKGAGAETFTATAYGTYEDTHANDYDTYVTVNDLTIAGDNGAVFGNYVIKYAGHGTEAIREQTETGTYENATFRTTETFGTPGRITALGFTVAAINQTMTYGDSYPTINDDGEHWGEGKVWSLPGTPLATGDRIWVTLKWNASIPTSSAGYYTAGTHTGALVVDKIVIQRTDGTDVTASYKPTFQAATLMVDPRLLTVTVDGANFSKVYDGNCTTEKEDRAYTVDEVVADAGTGKFAADDVTVEGTYTYNDKDVGDASYVIFSEQTLTGTDAANYTLGDVTSVDSSTGATITCRPCDITVTTTGKTYDGNVTANAIATYAFSNLVQKNESDVKEDFTLAIDDFTGTFNSKDVETANTVTFTHEGKIADHLTGKDETSILTNYDFTFKPTAEAKIAPRHVSVTWKAKDKNYDQNTVAEPTLGSFVFATPVDKESFIVSDENAQKMTYAFSDKNVGKDKTVTASGWTQDLVTEGPDTLKSNYLFDFVSTATAEIKPIKLTIAYAANDKTYDATTTATRKGDFTYAGLIVGDEFALDDAEMHYDFDTKDVGTGKTVTAEGFDAKLLVGADVQNYEVEFTDTTTAAIEKKKLTLTLSEAKKVYDGTVDYAGTVTQVIPGTEGGEVFTATGTGAFTSKLVGSAADYFEVTKLDVAGTNGADFGNYTITYNGGTIGVTELNTIEWSTTVPFRSSGTITKKPLTLKALPQEMEYAEKRPSLAESDDWTAEGLETGDTLTVTLDWNEAKIAKTANGHEAVGTHADAIALVSALNDNYTVSFVSASLTVVEDANKELRIGWANKDLPIMVSTAWLDAHVPEFEHWADDDGHQKTSDGLLATGANGYPLWQSYLLGLDPTVATAKLWIDGVQTADADNMHVLYHDVDRPTAAAGYAVHFRLDTVLKGATEATPSPYQPGAEFDIALDGENPTGTYSIQCVFTKKDVASKDAAENLVTGVGVSSDGIRTVNTFGLLKVVNEVKNTIASVAWTKLNPSNEDQPVALANLLKTAGLAQGDSILRYSNETKCFDAWMLSQANDSQTKVWTPVKAVSDISSVKTPVEAENATLDCGTGVMLVREDASKPFYLFGQVPSKEKESTVLKAEDRLNPTFQMLAAPGFEDLDLNSHSLKVTGQIAETASAKALYDQIFVTDDKEPIMYTYKDGEWGYDARFATTVAGMTFYTTKRVTNLPKVKAGTGFWYVSRGGDPTILWSVEGKEVSK